MHFPPTAPVRGLTSRADLGCKFVRLGESWLGARKEWRQYQDVVREHAREGWRPVQVLAPSLGVYGVARYVEVILERELPS